MLELLFFNGYYMIRVSIYTHKKLSKAWISYLFFNAFLYRNKVVLLLFNSGFHRLLTLINGSESPQLCKKNWIICGSWFLKIIG